MSNELSQGLCQRVEDEIASILAGNAEPALFDHIAVCDRCRDFRHDATMVAQAVASAGADYVHPTDFEQQLIEKLAGGSASAEARGALGSAGGDAAEPQRRDAVEAPADRPEPKPAEPSGVSETVSGELEAGAVGAVAGQPAAPSGSDAKEPVAAAEQASEAKAAVAAVAPSETKDVPTLAVPSRPGSLGERAGTALRGRGAKVVALGVVSVSTLAAAAAIAIHMHAKHSSTALEETAQAPWSGEVVSFTRASSDTRGGLELCAPSGGACKVAAEGERIKPGTMIRTDLHTRAHVELSDGSRVAIDRGTDLVLVDRHKRVAKLSRGSVVADVVHVEQGPGAQFELPVGTVDVIGTKIAVSATEDRGTVEVVRGVVRVTNRAGASAVVGAGEEGTIERGRSPEVTPATGIADSVAWSERGETEKGQDEMQVRGLGELRARKPGETSERDRAVRLAKHDLRVRVVDSIARTEIDETFANDTGDVLEGIYRFPLPTDAQIERLALEVNGKLEEGAFVDKDRAAAIWRGVIQNAAPKAPKPREEIIWVPGPWRDPALLEWQRGGRFELRIYPIPAHGSRRVVLAYTQTIPAVGGVRRYTYPLSYDPSGSTRVGEFSADLHVRGLDPAFSVRSRGYELRSEPGTDPSVAKLSMNARSFVPSGDLTIEYMLPSDKMETTAWAYRAPAGVVGVSADGGLSKLGDASYVAIALRPKLPRWSEGKLRDQVIVVDSSRSMVGERYKRATRLAEAIVREMDKRDRVSVMTCDSECRTMPAEPSGAGAAASQRVREFLESIKPDGATDLVAAVREAHKVAVGGRTAGRELRIVYIGDGSASAGPVRPAHIAQEIARALPDGSATLTAVAVGSDADARALAAMARGGGGVVIPYVPGERAGTVAMQVLAAGYGMSLRNPVVELPEGLSDVYPKQVDTIRAGGEVYLVARMAASEASGMIRLRGKVGGDSYEQTYPVKLVASSSEGNAFVPRLYAATKMGELEATQGENAKADLIDLSKQFAVASSYTSMLVLESPAMFKAFGVDRPTAGVPTWSGETDTESTGADGDRDFGTNADELSSQQGLGGGPRRPGASAPRAKAYRTLDDAEMPTGGLGLKGAAAPAEVGAGAGASESKRKDERWAQPPAASPPPAPTATMVEPIREPPRMRRPRPMIPMKRVWDRNGSVLPDVGPAKTVALSKIAQLESDAAANPDSRAKLEGLLGACAQTGQIDRAADLAERWSSRDALDPGALASRAALAARDGQRDRAIRILGGLADLRPADTATQSWLASLYDSMGDAQRACSHRLALAELRPSDPIAVGGAVRCARATGANAFADALLADVTKDTVRTAIERELAKTVDTTLKGDITIDATWESNVDLDVALIGKNGERYAWTADPKARVTSRGATSPRAESIAILTAPAGDYIIEISRGDRQKTEPVRGSLAVKAVGAARTIPFVLVGNRVEAGSVKIFYTARLVPVTEW